MEKRGDLASGMWKFDKSVSESELVAIAEDWAKDEKFLGIYIRKCSKDQYGLGFVYKYDQEAPTTLDSYDAFVNEYKDRLYKKFGIGLVGWDIANATSIIKGITK